MREMGGSLSGSTEEGSSLYKRDGESVKSKTADKVETKEKGRENEEKGGCAVHRLRWDWDSAEDWHVIVIQPALELSHHRDAQLEALGEMKGRGVGRSTKLQCCLEHDEGRQR